MLFDSMYIIVCMSVYICIHTNTYINVNPHSVKELDFSITC